MRDKGGDGGDDNHAGEKESKIRAEKGRKWGNQWTINTDISMSRCLTPREDIHYLPHKQQQKNNV